MKNDLKYLWYYLGSTCSKGEKKIFGNPQSKKAYILFFRA